MVFWGYFNDFESLLLYLVDYPALSKFGIAEIMNFFGEIFLVLSLDGVKKMTFCKSEYLNKQIRPMATACWPLHVSRDTWNAPTVPRGRHHSSQDAASLARTTNQSTPHVPPFICTCHLTMLALSTMTLPCRVTIVHHSNMNKGI